MSCPHRGFHHITSRYDHDTAVLVFLRECERCGAALGEVERVEYRPRFVRGQSQAGPAWTAASPSAQSLFGSGESGAQ